MKHRVEQWGLGVLLVACGARQTSSSESSAAGVSAGPQSSTAQATDATEASSDASPYENCHGAAIERSSPEAAAGILVCNTGLGVRFPDLLVEGLADSCGGAGHGASVLVACSSDAECPEGARCDVPQGFCELPLACDSAADCGEGEACFCANSSVQAETTGWNSANVCKHYRV